MVRAVVFDLWQTLVPWPSEAGEELRRSWAAGLGVTVEQLDEHWYGDPDAYRVRETGPLLHAVTALRDALGATTPVDELIEGRIALTRRVLTASPEVDATLRELRARGYAIGLVSNCTEDVAVCWPESSLAPLVDHAVFSATAGCMKPDPLIYRLVCDGLGVDASECLFVGDGANDELRGAASVGMTPVLLAEDGVARWDGLEAWAGVRIQAIPEVLELVA
jgi:putative hydrolase of the HAD superfamily